MTTLLDFAKAEVRRSGNRLVGPVDWQIGDGEHWIVLGPNGAGKTTLLRVAAGYLVPTRGRARVLGQTVGEVDLRDLRPRVGFLSHAMLDVLHHDATAHELVVAGLRAAATVFGRFEPSDEDWAGAGDLLARFGVKHLADRRFDSLSQGERQRVLLARSLVARPDLLLLDEPSAGIDLPVREQLLADLDDLAADPGAPASVLVTHRVEDIPPGYTHVLLLREGRVVAAGPVTETLTASALRACFGVDLEIDRRHGRWWAWRP